MACSRSRRSGGVLARMSATLPIASPCALRSAPAGSAASQASRMVGKTDVISTTLSSRMMTTDGPCTSGRHTRPTSKALAASAGRVFAILRTGSGMKTQKRGRSGNGTLPARTCMRPSSAQRCSCGNTLPGLSSPLAVEGAFHPLLLRQIDLGEHRRHQVALLDADAMLAGQHAADLDAQPQDVGAELPRRARVRPPCWRRRE